MKAWLKRADDWIDKHRPWTLLATAFATLAALATVNWLTGANLFERFFYPTTCDPKIPEKCDPIEWKELFQAALLLLGLPVAFWLWHWRDRNVQDQIENSRKDINLKEFLEVQKMAAGLFDKGMDEHAQTDLQVAALHQLSDYLGVDHPKSFRRAAFEILWPSGGVSKERMLSYAEWSAAQGGARSYNFSAYQQYVDEQFAKLDRVALARIGIIHDEWRKYFRSGFPLSGRDFSFLSLPIDADLSSLDLSSCRFIRSSIERVKFNKANLRFAVIDRAFAAGASFGHAAMFGAHIECSGLMPDNREGSDPFSQPVDLRETDLRLAKLRNNTADYALLQGSNLPGYLFGTSFKNAVFDDATQIASVPGSSEQDVASTLRKLGAKHADEV